MPEVVNEHTIIMQAMGMVFGGHSGEILPYEVIKDAPAYEIRAYDQHLVAQTNWQNDSKATFMSLASYIGAFEEPQNKTGEKVAMTTPVECLSDTDRFTSMRFFPPKEHQTVDSMPEPLSSSIAIETLPKRYVAARRFSGSVDLNRPRTDPSLRPHLLHLMRALLDDGLIKAEEPCDTDEAVWRQLDAERLKDSATGETTRWSLAVYNPPFCLPFLRRNEIWVSLSPGAARGEQ